MAEAWLNHLCGDELEASSAGLEPGVVNPLAVEAMSEVGIDISQNKTHSVFDLFKSGQIFKYVVTICDEAAAEQCPIFVGVTTRVHWNFPDPSSIVGTRDEKLAAVRRCRDSIRNKIEEWCGMICPSSATF